MPRLTASSPHRVSFRLNGRAVSGQAEPRMLLSDFIRHVLGATGTHVGCEHGVCGACTVQIDGVPARSCLALAVQVEGADIRTVEGSGAGSGPSVAVAKCVPGQLRSAMRLLYAGHSDVARRAAR